MKKTVRGWLVLLLLCLPFIGSVTGQANELEVKEPPVNDVELYQRYQDNSFQILTKEATSLLGVKAALLNVGGTLKEIVWAGVLNTGKANAVMVHFLFSYDLDSAIKTPIVNLTASMADGMLTIASSLGILSVALILMFKFVAEQQFRQVLRTFFMTIGVFTGLVLFSNSNNNDSLASKVVDIDNYVEAQFVKVNPVFTSQETTTIDQSYDSADVISAKIFRTNVYEPYLLFMYGTANEATIRKESVSYKKSEYDRISLLLDNDSDTKENEKLVNAVTKYEAETLNNQTISWQNNLNLVIQGIFYLLLNIVQGFIYFVLCVLRLMLVLLRWLLFLFMPILLLFSLFNTQVNAFTQGGKGFVTVVGFKALVSFALVFVASYMSLGYEMSSSIDDPILKMITILLYLVTPFGVYFFRTLILKMVTGQLSLNDTGRILRNPYKASKTMNRASKEQAKLTKQQRKQQKKDYKERKRAEKEARKNNQPLNQPKTGTQPRSERRNEERPTDKRYPNNAKPTDERAQEVGNGKQSKPIDKRKPSIQANPLNNTHQRFSSRRTEGTAESPQRKEPASHKKSVNVHGKSRYEELVAQRNRPEQQRLKQQSHERLAFRQQERQRIKGNGRSTRRIGQAMHAPTGTVQINAGNTHKQTGKAYTPQPVTRPLKSTHRLSMSRKHVPKTTQKRVTATQPIRTMTKQPKQRKQPQKQRTNAVRTPHVQAKGVKRRRV